MSERAFAEVIASGRWSFAEFVRGVDDIIEEEWRLRVYRPAVRVPANLAYSSRQREQPLPPRSVWREMQRLHGPARLIENRRQNPQNDLVRSGHISDSSVFFSSPFDAGYLLREEVTGGYAAARRGTPLPHWIEIELRDQQLVDGIDIKWHDEHHYAIEFEIRISDDGSNWKTLLKVQNNSRWKLFFDFPPQPVMRMSLIGMKFSGQDRMLIKRVSIWRALVQDQEVWTAAKKAWPESDSTDVIWPQ